MGSLLLTSIVGMLTVIGSVSRVSAVEQCPEAKVQCLIHPCATLRCAEGYICVPKYCGSCQGICIPAKCSYNGQEYNVGDTFPATDGCNTCTCASTGAVGCTKIYCPCRYNGQEYNVGDTFPATDGCNTCTCTSNGAVGCTKIYCPKCKYNDQEYNAGDTFPATDGCNTCTCSKTGTVGCTEKYCPQCPAIRCAACYHGTVFSADGCPTCTCRQKCKKDSRCQVDEFCNGQECCPNWVKAARCSDPCSNVKCPTSKKCERFCNCFAACVPDLSVAQESLSKS